MDMTDQTTSAPSHTGAHRAAHAFRVGDVVRNGSQVATVTDVGTVLVAVRTAVGTPRMVCPWELAGLPAAADELRSHIPAQ
jgi:hypothetical protein